MAKALQLPLPVATVLVSRGHTEADASSRFLNPRLSDLSDPFQLPGMMAAVDRIWKCIDGQERVCIFGDYDVDGVCSSALLVNVLRELGLAIQTFVPDRLQEGYGLSVAALTRCLEQHRPNVIITVDCGTGSCEAVAAAAAAGVDVIVTDHHEPSEGVADALAVVNPKLGSSESAKSLAGVGVAFKLCHALVKAGMKAERPIIAQVDLRRHLDLVAVGTIADIVPLEGENRILARHGLARLNRFPRVGLSEILKVAGVTDDIDSYHIGFVIGPRLNAAGRLGDAGRALKLLLTEELETARALAQELDDTNRERRRIEQLIQADAQQQIDADFKADSTFGIVLGKEGWHQGTVGIVASRLCSRYFRPSVVIGFDKNGFGRGSCRSIPGFDLLEVLECCSEHLLTFGGHTMAAGLSLNIDHLEAFAEQFNRLCTERLAGREMRPVQKVDAWLQFGDTDWRLLEALDSLRPFGMGNPTPTWGVRGVSLAGPAKQVGKDARHWKLRLAQGGSVHEAVAFNMGQVPIPEGKIDVLFQARPNTYRGGNAIELHVQDLRPSAEA